MSGADKASSIIRLSKLSHQRLCLQCGKKNTHHIDYELRGTQRFQRSKSSKHSYQKRVEIIVRETSKSHYARLLVVQQVELSDARASINGRETRGQSGREDDVRRWGRIEHDVDQLLSLHLDWNVRLLLEFHERNIGGAWG
jgi:hypothetical protein